MELHISSDDPTFITGVFDYADDSLDSLDGYASVCGYDTNMNMQHRVVINRSEVGERFPKRMTFGQMLDMMKQAGSTKVYFQREDWRDTHRCIALNNTNVKALYIDEYYEETRVDKASNPIKVRNNGVPFDKRPYIPNYEDMFAHSWVVYASQDATVIYKNGGGDEKKSIGFSSF